MLKFTDSNGEVIATLDDDDNEPEFIEDAKKKSKSKKRIKADDLRFGLLTKMINKQNNYIKIYIYIKTN